MHGIFQWFLLSISDFEHLEKLSQSSHWLRETAVHYTKSHPGTKTHCSYKQLGRGRNNKVPNETLRDRIGPVIVTFWLGSMTRLFCRFKCIPSVKWTTTEVDPSYLSHVYLSCRYNRITYSYRWGIFMCVVGFS